jgi:hypothetical protein
MIYFFLILKRKMPRIALTTEQFIERAKLKRGDEYDYSKTIYKNMDTKIIIIHLKCGTEFSQTPYSHLNLAGTGCGICSKNIKHDNEKFIENAKLIHEDRYNYDSVKYKNLETPVSIKCLSCNKKFWKRPDHHIKRKSGCLNCYPLRKKKSTVVNVDDIVPESDDENYSE